MKLTRHCASCSPEGNLSLIGKKRIIKSKARKYTLVKRNTVNMTAATTKKFDITKVKQANSIKELKAVSLERYDDSVNNSIRAFLKEFNSERRAES